MKSDMPKAFEMELKKNSTPMVILKKKSDMPKAFEMELKRNSTPMVILKELLDTVTIY